MKLTVVAVICHSLASAQAPACREAIVSDDDAAIGFGCLIAEGSLDDWKSRSIYRGPQWRIERVKCVPGDYLPKEST